MCESFDSCHTEEITLIIYIYMALKITLSCFCRSDRYLETSLWLFLAEKVNSHSEFITWQNLDREDVQLSTRTYRLYTDPLRLPTVFEVLVVEWIWRWSRYVDFSSTTSRVIYLERRYQHK